MTLGLVLGLAHFGLWLTGHGWIACLIDVMFTLFARFDERLFRWSSVPVPRKKPILPCTRCKIRQGAQSHGYCYLCRKLPEVLVVHPMREKRVPEPPPTPTNSLIDPLLPTSAPPGTEAKVRVLAARFAAQAELWHPRDARAD